MRTVLVYSSRQNDSVTEHYRWLLLSSIFAACDIDASVAIRDNQIAASAMGVDLPLYKTLAFGISAAFIGIAGALGAIVVQFVAPDSFTFQLAIAIFVGMVVGGVGWLPGSLVGAAFIVFVPNVAESVSKGLRRGVRRDPVRRYPSGAARRKAGRVLPRVLQKLIEGQRAAAGISDIWSPERRCRAYVGAFHCHIEPV